MLTTTCPHCATKVQVPDTAVGRSARCHGCNNKFIITDPRQAPPPGTIKTKAPGVMPDTASRGRRLVPALVIGIAVVGATALFVFGGDRRSDKDLRREIARLEGEIETLRDAGERLRHERDVAGESLRQMEVEATRLQQELIEVTAETEALRDRLRNPASTSPTVQPAPAGTDPQQARTDDADQAAMGPAPSTGGETPPSEPLSVADIVERIAPSVALLRTEHGTGTGFFFHDGAHLLTNHHVVSGGRRLTVRLAPTTEAGQRDLPARVIAVDAANDLALVQLHRALTQVRPLQLEATRPLRPGEDVIVIGSPGIGEVVLQNSVSTGVLSNTAREFDGRQLLQTTAAINPGNSGGPLLDRFGKVIGVVTLKASAADNIGFAVPSALVERLWQGRGQQFQVTGDFVRWEEEQGVAFSFDDGLGIALSSMPTNLTLAPSGTELYATLPESNKVAIIDLESRDVVEVFAGTEPMDLELSRDGLWVANASSKSFTFLSLNRERLGKVERTISLQTSPMGFAVVGSSIWYFDQGGDLYAVSTSRRNDYEKPLPFNVRSLAKTPGKRRLFASSADAWLYEIDGEQALELMERVAGVAARVARATRDGDLSDSEQRRMERDRRLLAKTEAQLAETYVKHSQAAGTRTDFSTAVNMLFVDETHGRIYFNRAALKLDEPASIIGVFKPSPHSRSSSKQLRDFIQRFPGYDQIHAASPDGQYVASGTHIYRADDFTVHAELPVPTGSIVFAPDSRTVYLSNPVTGGLSAWTVP